MAENEVVVEDVPVQAEEVKENVQPEEPKKPSGGARFWGGVKESLRKFVVKLKRRPMNIAFFVLIISTLVNLLSLGNISQLGLTGYFNNGNITGIAVFISQLFCILVLVLFLNAFPKRSKKPKIAMLVLLFVFMAVLMAVDLYIYITWTAKYATVYEAGFDDIVYARLETFYHKAVNGILAHCIIVGISALLTATYPLYGKLINKINTRKNIESTEIKEEIDTSAEV